MCFWILQKTETEENTKATFVSKVNYYYAISYNYYSYNIIIESDLIYNVQNRSEFSWGVQVQQSSNICSAVPYTGNVCKDVLSTWQQCVFDGSAGTTIYVSNCSESVTERETNASWFFHSFGMPHAYYLCMYI